MPDAPAHPQPGFSTRDGQPLIGVLTQEGPDEVVRYFTSEQEADEAISNSTAGIERALSAIGGWSDLDFDEMLDELDRIRHRSKPTPPIAPDL